MAYEIRQTVTPTRNGPGQYTATTTTERITIPRGGVRADHNYNHWATTSRLAQGYYDRPQYTNSRRTTPGASTTTTAGYGPGGVYTAKTYAPYGVYTTTASYTPVRSYTSNSMAGVRSGPPYAPGTYTTTSTTSYTPTAYNPTGSVFRTSALSDRSLENRFSAMPGRWPVHDLFRPTVGGGLTTSSSISNSAAQVQKGTSTGYLQGQIPPAEIVPGASGITADRATKETADVYASELRPAVVYEKRIRKENEQIQDIVDRNRYTTEIRQVIQPVQHIVNLAEKEEHNSLAVVKRGAAYNSYPDQIERYERQRKLYPSGALIAEGETTEKKTVYKEPVIRERIRARIIEEIQPVVYREVVQPVHVKSEQPIQETVIHGATVREIVKAEPITFEEFERCGYRLEGRERQERVNSHTLF